VIYLYAITEPAADVSDCRGHEDQQLELLVADGLAGAYSSHGALECGPDPEMLWRHEEVVERLMARSAILPARFGTTLPDADALADSLSREADRLRPQLERVRGCVELAVRVNAPAERASAGGDGEGDGPGDGRDYLNAKLAEQRERESLAQRTLVPLSRLAADSRRHQPARDSGVITASYLVPERDISRFADEVRLLQREHEELVLSCTGPWAPYSFTESSAGEAEAFVGEAES
jgi:hypothetical protein